MHLMSGGWYTHQDGIPEDAELWIREVKTLSPEDSPMKALPPALLAACETKLQEERKPFADLAARLRCALDGYTGLFEKDVERRVVGAMLAALGQAVPEPDPNLERTCAVLRETLWDFLNLLPDVEVTPSKPALDTEEAQAPSEPDPVPEAPPSRPKEGNGKTSHTWPALPNLRTALSTGKTLMFVGGWRSTDKLATVRARFGLEPEWYETNPARPHHSAKACNRIRGGKVAAVVAIEGFMTHKDWRRISDACASTSVPMVKGDTAGVGSLEAALAEIDSKLA